MGSTVNGDGTFRVIHDLILKDFEGGLWIDTRVAFGGVAGCGIFGRPADAWKDLMQAQLTIPRIFCWVDDNMLLKRPRICL